MLVDHDDNYSPSERLLGAVMAVAATVILAVAADVASNGRITGWLGMAAEPREAE